MTMTKIHLDNLEYSPISDPFIQLHLQSLLSYKVTVKDFQNTGMDLPIFSLWRGVVQAYSALLSFYTLPLKKRCDMSFRH